MTAMNITAKINSLLDFLGLADSDVLKLVGAGATWRDVCAFGLNNVQQALQTSRPAIFEDTLFGVLQFGQMMVSVPMFGLIFADCGTVYQPGFIVYLALAALDGHCLAETFGNLPN
jgi:hypothetical protein